MISSRSLVAMAGLSLLVACSDDSTDTSATDTSSTMTTPATTSQAPATQDNPFFTPSTLDLQFPRFDLIRNEHYLPAFERGMAEQLTEIAEITAQTAAPSFANTLVPLEISGQTLNRVSSVFFSLSSAHTNDAIQALEVELSPRLSAHSDEILLNDALFARIKTVYDNRANEGLDPESLRLLEETYKDFVRAGALLNAEQKVQLKAFNSELAELGTTFDQNVLAEVNANAIVVENRDDLAGLSDAEIQGAADAAAERGMPGKYVIPLLNTSGQPSLSQLENRALRQRIMETSLARGSSGGEHDNRGILSRTAQLRAEKARLLGYPSHAAYVLEEQTAKTVDAVEERLGDLTPRAIANAEREAADLQEMIQREGGDFQLASWDWAFYAEKVRQERYSFDEGQLRPYFELNNVLEKGVFYAAEQIYGITFKRRTDLPVYQEDVRVYEVFDANGQTLALFIEDPYARPSKRGGAWMNDYVPQSTLLDTKAVVANHLNIPKPPAGEPTLLTFDEVITMFHEFGHALHGMFSNVTYPSFSGTNVPRDFVEYPSQVNEMWAVWPEVLKHYALNYQTGEPMPEELVQKVMDTRKFNQGFATSEYLMASITDMALHVLTPEQVPTADTLMQFEVDTLTKAGANLPSLPPRYRLPYFSHIMGGYEAGYYSYIWSEVLDADTVEWFKENGGMTRANGQHFRDTLLSRGGSVEAMQLFRDFRGRDPVVEPLLERRGLN
jgi:peptidyl-dipeptidase Dcp